MNKLSNSAGIIKWSGFISIAVRPQNYKKKKGGGVISIKKNILLLTALKHQNKTKIIFIMVRVIQFATYHCTKNGIRNIKQLIIQRQQLGRSTCNFNVIFFKNMRD